MSTETGILVEVTETEEGSTLAADVTAGDLLIPLVNADDFAEPGLCELAGETYAYTDVTDDDVLVLDPSTPLLADVLVDDDETCYSLSDTGTRDVVRHAWVTLDDEGDPVPAEIPTGKRGMFRLGDVDLGSLVKVTSQGDSFVVESRPVDLDVMTGTKFQTANSGTRITLETIPNAYESDQEWGLLRFYNSDPDCFPGQVWSNYTPGTPKFASLRITSPYFGTDEDDAAKISLEVDDAGLRKMVLDANTFLIGSGGTSVDINAHLTNQFSFRGANGQRLNLAYQLGYNAIISRDVSAVLMRLDLEGTQVRMKMQGAADDVQFQKATGNDLPWLGRANQNSGVAFETTGGLRFCNATAEAGGYIETKALVHTDMSDRRFKSNITPVADALDTIAAVPAIDYDNSAGVETRRGRGLIAQDLAEQVPHLTLGDGSEGDPMSVSSYGVAATVWAGVSELHTLLKSALDRIDALEVEVAELKK